jgi:hypothetical protein
MRGGSVGKRERTMKAELEMMGMRNIGNLTSYDTSMTSATYDDD